MMTGTPIDLDKMRSVGYLSRGRTRNRVRTVTRADTGEKAKETTDELGTVITESANRQDVNVNPETHITELLAGV
jgi:hypothetical protein